MTRSWSAIVAGLVGIASLALAAIGDRLYFANAIEVAFHARHDEERVLVTRTIEHRVAFSSRYRALSRILQGWPFETLPIPARTPRLDADVSALITVPVGEVRHFDVRTDDAHELAIDGANVSRLDPIGSGRHRLSVHWHGSFGDHRSPGTETHLELLWGPSPDDLVPIPREELIAPSGRWPTSRIAWWVGVLALGGVFALLCGAIPIARTRESRRRRMHVALAAAIVALGLCYRAIDYDVMPEYRENADEAFAMWSGWSLLEEGRPRGWTPWREVYEGPPAIAPVDDVWAFGVDYRVVTPYFEHPPLLHVLVGAANHLAGTRRYLACRLRDGRIVPILLGGVSILLVILVARRLEPHGPAPWIGALLYATMPFIALQQRVVKEEALLTPLALAATYFFLRWRDEGRRRAFVVLAAICVGLAPLAKVPGAALIPALVMLLLAAGDRRAALIATYISTATSSVLFVYGALVDWTVFVAATGQQTTRPVHFNIFLRWFDDPLVNHNLIGRGWAIFLWIAAVTALLARRRRDGAVLFVPAMMYLLAISIGSGNWTYGWYALPVYPYLCIAAGWFVAEQLRRPSLLGGMLFVTVFVFYGLNFVVDPVWATDPRAWPLLREIVSLALLASLAPFCLVQIWDRPPFRGLARATIAVGLALHVVLAGIFVARYETHYDTYRNFDRVVFFDR